MADLKVNPYRPGKLIAPGMFAGRIAQIERLERALVQTKHGNATHFMVRGERGIGKSSLLFLFHKQADGTITVDGARYKFLVVAVELDTTTTFRQIIIKIGTELKRQVAERHQGKELAKSVLTFLSKWEAMGVSYNDKAGVTKDEDQLLEDLTVDVAEVLKKENEDIDGLFVLIDEADKPESTSALGVFCKLFTERVQKRGADRVAVGLAGLPSLVARLREGHESAPRIFEDIPLDRLGEEDCKYAVNSGLTEANKKNSKPTTITDEANNRIATLSQGFPNFIQQFASCAFESDTDWNIDLDDVEQGANGEQGAIYQLGVKYFHEMYFEQVLSDDYRQILRAMAKKNNDDWVTKDEIRAITGLKDSTVTNAVSALKKRNIILAKDGNPGVYRLPTRSFAAWILLRQEEEASAAAKKK